MKSHVSVGTVFRELTVEDDIIVMIFEHPSISNQTKSYKKSKAKQSKARALQMMRGAYTQNRCHRILRTSEQGVTNTRLGPKYLVWWCVWTL